MKTTAALLVSAAMLAAAPAFAKPANTGPRVAPPPGKPLVVKALPCTNWLFCK